MSSKDSEVGEVTPLQVQSEDIVNTVQSEPIFSRALHVGSSSHLKLPDGGVVKETPRGSNPTYADKNSTESGTGQQLCSSCESSTQPEKKRLKLTNEKKTNSEKNIRAPVHNLPGPPPEKVTWVLAGPGGNVWDAFVDGHAVTQAEKLRWAEAFVLSIRNNGDNGN